MLRATATRPRLAYALDWADVDDTGPAPSGGVRLLSTRWVGALTVALLAARKEVD